MVCFLAILTALAIVKVCLGNRENIALGKTAGQSSLHYWGYTGSVTDFSSGHLVVDGDTSSTSPRQCWQSLAEDRPWWSVDLGQIYGLGSFRIFIRSDQECTEVATCEDRLRGFEIYLSDSATPPTAPSEFGNSFYHSNIADLPAVIEVDCSSETNGRHVTITVPSGNAKILSLCEVEIFEFVPFIVSTMLGNDLLSTEFQMESVAPSFHWISSSIDETRGHVTSFQPSGQVLSVLDTSGEFITRYVSYWDLPDPSGVKEMSQTTVDKTSVEDNTKFASMGLLESSQVEINNQNLKNESGWCECPCVENPNSLQSDRFMAGILDGLTIDKNKVSRVRRKYESANDERPSAKAIGCLGALLLGLFFGCVLILDFTTVLGHVIMLRENLRNCFRRQAPAPVPAGVRGYRDVF